MMYDDNDSDWNEEDDVFDDDQDNDMGFEEDEIRIKSFDIVLNAEYGSCSMYVS